MGRETSGNQTWLAGKYLANGGFKLEKKTINGIFSCDRHVWLPDKKQQNIEGWWNQECDNLARKELTYGYESKPWYPGDPK